MKVPAGFASIESQVNHLALLRPCHQLQLAVLKKPMVNAVFEKTVGAIGRQRHRQPFWPRLRVGGNVPLIETIELRFVDHSLQPLESRVLHRKPSALQHPAPQLQVLHLQQVILRQSFRTFHPVARNLTSLQSPDPPVVAVTHGRTGFAVQPVLPIVLACLG